jgi:Fe-S cluster assembly protein SufD
MAAAGKDRMRWRRGWRAWPSLSAKRLAGRGAPAEALARLTAMGLPGRRDEYWRYTDPASLNAPEAPQRRCSTRATRPRPSTAIDRLKLVFVDGVFDPRPADDPRLAGVEIERLTEAGGRDSHWAQGLYGVLEARGQSPVPRPWRRWHTAFATDGVLIRVTGRAKKPVSLIYRHESERSDAILHHCVKLEPGAELTLLENGPAAARFTKVLEVEVAEGARFHHIRTLRAATMNAAR